MGVVLCRCGAVSVEEEERDKQRQRSAAFQGAGFRLGDIEGPSQVIGSGAPPTQNEENVSVCFISSPL